MPRVSVVMPCYNAERFIAEAIRSVLAQTFQDWECIVVDDGSTDTSPAIVAQFTDPRIRMLRQENRGPGAARNHGVAAATGEYIAFLDADDIALPHRLAAQLAVLEQTPELSVVGSGYMWIDEQNREIPWVHSWQQFPELNDLRLWLFDCPYIPSATMVRRTAYLDVGGIAEDLRGGEDWHLWIRMLLAGHRLGWHRDIVCRYRHHMGGLSQDAKRMLQDCIAVLRRTLDHPQFPAELKEVGQKALALRYIDGVKRLFVAGLWEEGRAALDQALALDAGLVCGNPSRVEDELVGVALDPLVPDPIIFMNNVFAHLPASAEPLRERQKTMLVRCHVELAARAVKGGSLAQIIRHGLPVFAAHPRWLLDRNVYVLAIRALRNRARAAWQRWRAAIK